MAAMVNHTLMTTTLDHTPFPIEEYTTVNTTEYIYNDHQYLQDCSIYCIYVQRHRHKLMTTLTELTSLLTLLAVLGIIGNSMVITVFLRSRSKHNSMYLMLFLAFVDLVTCSIVIPGIIFMEWRFEFYYDALCKVMSFLRYSVIPMSAMILVAIAVDRFVLICTPPHIRMTKFATKIIMAVILIIGMSFGVPPMLATRVWAKGFNQNVYFGFCISVYDTITIKQLDDYWYVVTAMFVFMILSMVILYSKVFITVYKQNKKWVKVRKNKIAPQKSVINMDDNSSETFGEQPASSETVKNFVTKRSENMISEMAQSTFTINSERKRKESVLDFDHVMKFDDQRYAPKIHPRYASRANSDFVGTQFPNQNFQRFSLVEKPCFTTPSSSGMLNTDNTRQEIIKELFTERNDTLSNAIQVEEVELTNTRSISMVHDPKELKSIQGRHMEHGICDKSKNNSNHHFPILGTKFNTLSKKKMSISMKNPMKSEQVKSSFLMASRSRPTHIKTTQVLFIVTLVYIVSFLPTFLMSNHLVPTHKVLYYIYFLNNAANPLIYSFMNPRFRQEIKKLFRSKMRHNT